MRTPGGDLSKNRDGTIALIGPTLIAKGLDQQVLIADITNTGEVDAKWRVELDLPVGDADDIRVAVAAGQVIRIEIPIKVTRAESNVSATVSLHDADGEVSASTVAINSVDLTECGQ